MTHESKNRTNARNDYQHDVFVVDWACVEKKQSK
jgi:hypothetical protein